MRINGEWKWIITLAITMIIAAIGFGRQSERIDQAAKELDKKADIQQIERIDQNIFHIRGDIKEIRRLLSKER